MPEMEGERPNQDILDQERATGEGMPEPPERRPTQTEENNFRPAPPTPSSERGGQPMDTQPVEPAPHPDSGTLPPEVPPAPMTVAEKRISPERNKEIAANLTTQPVARIAAAFRDREAINPDKLFPADEAQTKGQETAASQPQEIPTDIIKQKSESERKDVRPEQYTAWATGLSAWVRQETSADAPNRDNVKETLDSLGIKTDGNDAELKSSIDDFWEKYLKGESKIKEFSEALAEGCKEGDTINLKKVDDRTNATKELFKVFGKKDQVNLIVKDYATAYALLDESQRSDEIKQTVAAKITKNLQEEPKGDERERLQVLWNLRQEIDGEKKFNKDVDDFIAESQTKAISREDFNILVQNQNELERKFQEGKISKEDYDQEKTDPKYGNEGLFTFTDKFGIEEENQREALRATLKKTTNLSEEDIDDLIRHEKAHFDKARELGLNPQYAVEMILNSDGTYGTEVITTYDNIEGTKEDVQNKKWEIHSAPGIDRWIGHDRAVLGLDKEDTIGVSTFEEAKQKRERRLQAEAQTSQQPQPGEEGQTTQDEPHITENPSSEDEEEIDIDQIESSLTDEQRNEFLTKIQDKIEEALTQEQVIELIKKRDELTAQASVEVLGANDEQTTDEETLQAEARTKAEEIAPQAKALTEQIQKGVVEITTLEELTRALIILTASKDDIQGALAGIQQGISQIRQQGKEPLYSIRFLRTKATDGPEGITYLPDVHPKS